MGCGNSNEYVKNPSAKRNDSYQNGKFPLMFRQNYKLKKF